MILLTSVEREQRECAPKCPERSYCLDKIYNNIMWACDAFAVSYGGHSVTMTAEMAVRRRPFCGGQVQQGHASASGEHQHPGENVHVSVARRIVHLHRRWSSEIIKTSITFRTVEKDFEGGKIFYPPPAKKICSLPFVKRERLKKKIFNTRYEGKLCLRVKRPSSPKSFGSTVWMVDPHNIVLYIQCWT